MLPCPVPVALAARLPLPGLHWTGPLAVSARDDGLLPVPRLPAPDHADRRHDVRGHQAAAAHWLLALHLLTATKTNLAALELMRHLGVNYKTAWRMKHKIMQAMAEREEPRRLNGFVQIDDAYLGGERNGGKRGRGAEGKQPFVIAVQTDARFAAPSLAVIEPVRSFDNVSLEDWIARRLAPGCETYTDGLACFRRLEDAGHAHTTLDTGGGRAATEAPGARWVNVLLGNVKRAINGTYHAIRQAKYARRYLAKAAYRFNRRFRLHEMLPRLATAMLRCKPCPEPVLRAASNFHG